MKTFPTAKMDQQTLVFTMIFGAICHAVIGFCGYEILTKKAFFLLFPVTIVCFALVSSYLMIPIISVDSQKNILIKNQFVNFKIKREEIADLEIISGKKFNIRTFGVGGLFGYFGYFNGNDVWYVTNLDKKVQIKLKSGKTYMISPENTEDFLRELELLY
ncbi:PH domain-containing protein [Kaistella montana]|uniref:PH domain-containing protein n=1 Tax=Kaistella montana TaxID=1849733 RepID=A0ABW5K6F8_9FLAO|nr:PH domain-containing protein [Kaistella montana]MCQ4034768.1 PH domain-containing protein [Kaistella montana]